MTIHEANNFYKLDKKEYDLKNNKEFINWIYLLKQDNYKKGINISFLQDLINSLVAWYEIKYPEKELNIYDGINYPEFSKTAKLSKILTFEQLLFRLSSKEKNLLLCPYISGIGGTYYNKDTEEEIREIVLTYKIIEKEFKKEYFLFINSLSGEVIDKDILAKYNCSENNIEALYNILKKYSDLELDNIRTCLKNHKYDLLLRDKIIYYTALKLLYSKNTIPENGCIRAKRFIGEFNKKLQINFSDKFIDNIMQQDYNSNYNENSNYIISNDKLNILVKNNKMMIKRIKKIN